MDAPRDNSDTLKLFACSVRTLLGKWVARLAKIPLYSSRVHLQFKDEVKMWASAINVPYDLSVAINVSTSIAGISCYIGLNGFYELLVLVP